MPGEISAAECFIKKIYTFFTHQTSVSVSKSFVGLNDTSMSWHQQSYLQYEIFLEYSFSNICGVSRYDMMTAG